MTKGQAYENANMFLGLTPKVAFEASNLYLYKPINGSLAWTRGSTAYRTNQDGDLELMGNNVPRVDYSNTCPELLIEPESTNLLTYSQEFDNAAWSKIFATVTANSTTAPDGTMTADKIIPNAGQSGYLLRSNVVITSGLYYTNSIYLKYSGIATVYIYNNMIGTYESLVFNIQTGIISSNTYAITPKVEDVGGGWWRVQVSQLASTSTANICYIQSTGIGNGLEGWYQWGAQLEAKETYTSYIPTTSATVTRLADTNIEAITNSTNELSAFVRVRTDDRYNGVKFHISFDDDNENYVGLYYEDSKITFTTYADAGGDTFTSTSGDLSNGIHNVGFSFNTATKIYTFVIDGTEIDTGTIALDVPPVNLFTRVRIGENKDELQQSFTDKIITAMYFENALSSAELQALTV